MTDLPELTVEELWLKADFKPNPNQRLAILHSDGPLYLPAGPGSGKTSVLLWRTLNLLVFHAVAPEEIYLSTFTEKAARQLREGLRSLLSLVTNRTGVPYDISKMYVGTVHSLCQRLLLDRRLTRGRRRGKAPILLDELAQYFYLYKTKTWRELTTSVGFHFDANAQINHLFGPPSLSKHAAVTNAIALFNRLSEECIEPNAAITAVESPVLQALLKMYGHYRESLEPPDSPQRTDFSLLQQAALETLESVDTSRMTFRHVIIDEYQDTNAIQEKIFFHLANGHKNICVVGDDDQALYRFRGATVENFVEFEGRCLAQLGVAPAKIPLVTNYRSRKKIVDFYCEFISRCNWSKKTKPYEFHRVMDKRIIAHRDDNEIAVVASAPGHPEVVCAEIAELVRRLVDEKKVENANQIAFLFPSLKSKQVERMRAALEARDLKVYAPRARRFLEVDEAVDLFGVYLHIFGKPERGDFPGQDFAEYHYWLDTAYERAKYLLRSDPQMAQFVDDRREEIATAVADYAKLLTAVERAGWDLNKVYDTAEMKRALYDASGLSERAKRGIGSAYFDRIAQTRAKEGRPFTLVYVLRRASALDWSVLDLMYRLSGFGHFKGMFDLAESGDDEGPICNLGLISHYLARFMDEYGHALTGASLSEDRLQRLFFGLYLYALFRRGESEYEDAEDPFPRGRIPFLTIHQAKGLEFPVVVLGNPRKDDKGPQAVEVLVRPIIERESEPLERMSEFDNMRMYYVALSRAKNLLVIAHFSGKGQRISQPLASLMDANLPRIGQLDFDAVPTAKAHDDELPRNYSYTGDYLLYLTCPREYMVFRKYGFVPSRSQLMTFGSLVHRTMEDLHQYLISRRAKA